MKPARGFSIIETLLSAGILVTVLATLLVGLRAGHRCQLLMDQRERMTEVSNGLMDRLFQIQFGTGFDVAPTAAQLTELLDDDDNFGTVTLSSLRVAPPLLFRMADYPWDGDWQISVDADIDGNGDEVGPLDGNEDLLRIVLLHDGRQILESSRTRSLE